MRYQLSGHPLARGAQRQAERLQAPAGDLRERRRLMPHVQQLRVRERVHAAPAHGPSHLDDAPGFDDPLRRPQQQLIHDPEHRRVRRHTDRDRQRGHRGEQRALAQHAQRDTDFLGDRFHGGQAPERVPGRGQYAPGGFRFRLGDARSVGSRGGAETGCETRAGR